MNEDECRAEIEKVWQKLGHWHDYAPGTGWISRYRYCRVCGVTWRNPGEKPLIHNGKK